MRGSKTYERTGRDGTFEVTKVRLLLEQRFEDVTLSRSFEGRDELLAAEGQRVAVEVSVDTYQDKSGAPRFAFVAWRLNGELSGAAPLRAVVNG